MFGAVDVVQALTFAALGRAEDAIQTLRVTIEQDVPDHVRRRDEVFQEVVSTPQHFTLHYFTVLFRHPYTISRLLNRSQENVGQVSPLPILVFVHVIVQQPCKHGRSESMSKKIANYDLQGARATAATNILNVSKPTENHLVTKNTT